MKKPPPRTPTERAKARAEVDARIDAIVRRMEKGTWTAGTSHRAMADRFGISIDTIYEDARAAGAAMRVILASTPEQREAARAQHVATLERHRRLALRATKAMTSRTGNVIEVEVVPQPDLRAANEVLDQKAKVLGLYAPTVVEVGTPPPEVARMTLEELEALDAEIGRRRTIIQARIAELKKSRA